MSFKKVLELPENKIKLIRRLSSNKDFVEFMDLVEDILQTESYRLISNNVSNKEIEEDLHTVRGGYVLYKRLQELIKKTLDYENKRDSEESKK